MIQEVVGLSTELKFHRFLDLEILEDSQIPVEERRAVDHRQQCRTVLAHLRRCCETVWIDVLVRPEIRGRVARDNRIQLNRVSSQDGLVAYLDAFRVSGAHRTRDNRIIQLHVEVVVARAVGQVGATRPLRDARELPAVYGSSGELIAVDWTPQVNRIGHIENVPAV